MKAYGTLTIVDLLDNATYIYYADDAGGKNPSASSEGKKYIGIYSGPSFEGFPTKFPMDNWNGEWWSGWNKYVGEDGEDGKDGEDGADGVRGTGIIKVSTAPSSYTTGVGGVTPAYRIKLATVKEEGKVTEVLVGDIIERSYHHYPVIYVDSSYVYCGSRTSIRGATGPTGADANTYYIETNQEEILRFITENGVVYSPEDFTFKIFNNPKQDGATQIAINETNKNDYRLEIINEDDTTTLISKNTNYLGLGNYPKIGTDATENPEALGRTEDTDTIYFNIKKYLSNQQEPPASLLFRFSYLVNEKIAAIKIFEMRNGISDDMARFNLHASGITAAIQKTKLDFSAEGLKIYNGGLEIYNQQNNQVFYADGNGDLILTGTIYATNGEFTGKVNATDGQFNGSIYAGSGTIGGLNIGKEGNLGIIYSGDNIQNSPLRIYSNGAIYAQDMFLGNNTKIENHIQLGQAFICNPENNEGLFFKAGNSTLTQNGLLTIGKIKAYGGDTETLSYISAGTPDSSAYWEINGDGRARFKEIIVDKATIQSSVLETGTVQAVGSLMLFKDSWKIESVNGSVMTLASNTNDINLEIDDYITSNGRDFVKISSINGKNIEIENGVFSAGEIITKIGEESDYILSILGEKTDLYKDYACGNSLTIAQWNGTSGFEKKLILGDLNTLPENYGTTGIGLYADNVFLNGTLTTKIGNNVYAGVNTTNGATAKKFGEQDESKIVFWAGSEGTGVEDIRDAPFQVTENGSIYASQGVFEGSLISKSTIKGASIHTAKIYGEDEIGGEAPLKIYSANQGIEFIKEKDGIEYQLKIGQNGFYNYLNPSQPFISFSKIENEKSIEGVFYEGNEAKFSTLINDSNNKTSTIFINPLFIGTNTAINAASPNQKIQMDNGFDFAFFSNNNFSSTFQIQSDVIKSSRKSVFQQEVVFGNEELENIGVLEYKPATNGYDLYVR